MRAATAIVTPHAGFVPIGSKSSGDLLISYSTAIGRVRGAERARHRQRFGKSTIDADCPKTKIRLLRRTVSHRSEDHAAPIRRPPAHAIDAGMIGQPLRIAAGSRHNIDICVPGDGGCVSDLRTVRRKVRIEFDTLGRSNASRLSAAARDDPEVAGILKSHRVATHRWMTEQTRALGQSDS